MMKTIEWCFDQMFVFLSITFYRDKNRDDIDESADFSEHDFCIRT